MQYPHVVIKPWTLAATLTALALGTSVAHDASAVDCSKVPNIIKGNDGQPAGLLGKAYKDLCPAVEAVENIGKIIGILDTVQTVFNIFTGIIIEDTGVRMTADDLINARLDRIEATLQDGFALIDDSHTLAALDDLVEDAYSAREAFDVVSSAAFPVPAAQRADFERQLRVARNDSEDALQRVESIVRTGSELLANPVPGESEAQRQQRLKARESRRATLGYVSSELYAGTLGLHMTTLRMTEQAVGALVPATYSQRLQRVSSYIYLLIGSKAEACGHGYGASRDQLRVGNGGDLHTPIIRNTYQRSLINNVFYGNVTAAMGNGLNCNLTTNRCSMDFDERPPGGPASFPCTDERTGYFNACIDKANRDRNAVFSADPAVKVFRALMERINTRLGYIDKSVPHVGSIPQPDIPAGAFFDPRVYDDFGYATRPVCAPANGSRYYIYEY
jgi:hypothetical protein